MPAKNKGHSFDGLAAASRLSEETGHPGNDIRPCIASLLETPLCKGDFPNRNESAVVIASEFKRIGINYDTACKRLEYWNHDNSPPLKPSELSKAIGNAYLKGYNYSCHHYVLSAFCVDPDLCPFQTQVKSKKQKYNDFAFIDYGWPRLLSNRQVLIYKVALPHLEKTRQIGRGGKICANHKQIAEACGISRERVGKDLNILHKVGLIEYKVGSRQKWKGIASEIARLFPIPRPTRKTIEFLEKKTK